MPTGTPYNSFVAPYRIRVDDFTTAISESNETPLLHLLTHTHSDHINGLSAKSFGYKVYCSHDAKAMILRHEVYSERELHTMELRTEKIRTYSHLKVDPLQDTDGRMYYTGSRDLLNPLPLNTPTNIELDGNESVTITLLDANHCPGAVMFLIEGERGAVLHTGDFRGEPWFLDSLTRNPFLCKYISPEGGLSSSNGVSQTLEAIYLDTASVLSTFKPPTKKSATSGLIKLMKLLPDSAYFFLNCWTWGYEDILKAVATAFQSKIHVDRYKLSIYQCLSDTFLAHITTSDPSSTRFHACERFNRCSLVAVENDTSYTNATSSMGKRVVYVNPVNMENGKWEEYIQDTETRLRSGEMINNLFVPLFRHSTLPELQDFVSLFRPKRVVPNTLDPRLRNLDWACLELMFAPCLHASMQWSSSSASAIRHRAANSPNDRPGADCLQDIDVALKNLIGYGASEAAERWADHGKLMKKVSTLREYLGDAVIDELLGIQRPHEKSFEGRLLDISHIPMFNKGKGREEESDEETDCDSDDERGKTAHLLFANSDDKENAWWVSSQPSQEEEEHVSIDPIVNATPVKGRGTPEKDSAWRHNRMTPESSPVRPRAQPVSKPRTPQMTPLQSNFSINVAGRQTHMRASRGKSSQGAVLASPICLSSSPANAPRTCKKTKTSGKNLFVPTPRALEFSSAQWTVSASHPNSYPTHKQSTPLPGLSTNPSIPASSSKKLPVQDSSLTSDICPKPSHHRSAPISGPTANLPAPSSSSKKRPAQDASPISAKRPRLSPAMLPTPKEPPLQAASTAQPKSQSLPAVEVIEIVSDSEAEYEYDGYICLPWAPTVHEMKRLRKQRIMDQLAQQFPNRAKPSLPEEQKKLRAYYEGKKREMIINAAELRGKGSNALNSSKGAGRLVGRPLEPAKTIESFQTVDTDGQEFDVNRSRMLAEAVKDDLKHGRKFSLPALRCVRSPSPG